MLLYLIWTRVAVACGCITVERETPLDINEFVRQTDAVVFVGSVLAIRSLAPNDVKALHSREELERDAFFGTIATFHIDRYWSGVRFGETIEVATGGGCGFSWRAGMCYLVEAWIEDGAWHTGTCSMTAPMSDAATSLARLIVSDGPGASPLE